MKRLKEGKNFYDGGSLGLDVIDRKLGLSEIGIGMAYKPLRSRAITAVAVYPHMPVGILSPISSPKQFCSMYANLLGRRVVCDISHAFDWHASHLNAIGRFAIPSLF